MATWRELWKYRELVKRLVALDLKVRYRSSLLGFLWTLLNPLLLTLVLWLVFSRFSRIEEDNYALFLLSALMSWFFFSQSLNQALNSVIKNRSLIQKIYVPKLVFPFTVVTSNMVNLLFFIVAYFLIAAVSPAGIPLSVLILPAALLMLFIVTLGCALLLTTANVYFRDFQHLTAVILRALFYLTPIIYRPELLGETGAQLLKFNPVYYPISIGRSLLYEGVVPAADDWLIGFAVALGILAIGSLVFARFEKTFVYYA